MNAVYTRYRYIVIAYYNNGNRAIEKAVRNKLELRDSYAWFRQMGFNVVRHEQVTRANKDWFVA